MGEQLAKGEAKGEQTVIIQFLKYQSDISRPFTACLPSYSFSFFRAVLLPP